MANYGVASTTTAAGTNLTILQLICVGSVRFKVSDFLIGSNSTPADVATEFRVGRISVAGSGGVALTPGLVDPHGVAVNSSAKSGTFTVEPTWTNTIMDFSLNQRATFRWVAAPGFEVLSDVATGSIGVGLRSIASGGTPVIQASYLFVE